MQKAKEFITAYGNGEHIKAYGTYEEVFADKVRSRAKLPHTVPRLFRSHPASHQDVDAIYIGARHQPFLYCE